MDTRLKLVAWLFALVAVGTGCDKLIPFSAGAPVEGQKAYSCYTEFVRKIGDPLASPPTQSDVEFVETWHAYVWADNQAAASAKCTEQVEWGYEGTWITSRFTWQRSGMTVAEVTGPLPASDAPVVYGLPADDPDLPLAYGAPLGSDIVWNPPGAGEATAWIWVKDPDGKVRTANPTVKRAAIELAGRTGLPDTLERGGMYVPGEPHLRVSHLILELNTPFLLGDDYNVTNFYIESVGTVFGLLEQDGYSVPATKTKLYLHAVGVKGETLESSFCLTNTKPQPISVYWGPPVPDKVNGPSFSFNMDLTPNDIGYQMEIKASLEKTSFGPPYPFVAHQPWVVVSNKTTTNPVTLAALTIFDGDGPTDIDKVLWIENFDVAGEKYLGEGSTVSGLRLPHGTHQVTAVAYDKRKAYGHATMTLTIENTAPTAAGDTYADVVEDTLYVKGAPGVLGNDNDPDKDPMTASLVPGSGPTHGTLTLDPNGSFSYMPSQHYFGPDSFKYKASDGEAESEATVNLTVLNVNDPPVAGNDTYTMNEDAVLSIAAPGVLINDNDVDKDILTATLGTGPAHGKLTLNLNGSFTYTPVANYTGTDTFTYLANDGKGLSGTATVTITVLEVPDAQEAMTIIDMIKALEASGTINAGQAGALIATVTQTINNLQKNTNKVACNLFYALLNQLKAYIAAGILTQAEAQPLIDKAYNIMAERGC